MTTIDIKTQNELIEKHINQVNKMAWSFAKSTGVDFDDLKSEGTLALIRAIRRYDPDRELHLSTLVQIAVRNAMISYLSHSRKHTPTEAVDVTCRHSSGVQRYEFLDTLSKLGDEAKEVAKIIFEAPCEVLGIAADSSPCTVRVAIKNFLFDMGFTRKEINHGINEIKNALRY